jgi:hypothetical protein
MITERSQKQPFRTILRSVPISKKLQFMVGIWAKGDEYVEELRNEGGQLHEMLQKPFTVKKILEVIQQTNVSIRS